MSKTIVNQFHLGESGRTVTLSTNNHGLHCLVLDEIDAASTVAGFGDSAPEAAQHLADRLRELARLIEEIVHV